MTSLRLALTTLVVPDYDAGIAFFVDALGFDLIEDSDMGGGKRWVVVGGKDGGRLLLAKAVDDAQRAAIGNQTGGRVGFLPIHRILQAPMPAFARQACALTNSLDMRLMARLRCSAILSGTAGTRSNRKT